jgi:endonuclease YncB( thermonuclease family)
MKLLNILLALLLIPLVTGAPDEAMGRVTKVVDGDTIDVALQEHDSRIAEDLIRVRLADIDTPEVRGPKACAAGKNASAYTRTWLLSRYVFLDLDSQTLRRRTPLQAGGACSRRRQVNRIQANSFA